MQSIDLAIIRKGQIIFIDHVRATDVHAVAYNGF